jgi:hypothetical protein
MVSPSSAPTIIPRVRRILQMACAVHYLHTVHMIFPTSSYLHRIWHDMAKRTFFTRVHVEWKVATFNWSNHPAAMGNCVQYMQHTFHPFLIRPFLFYRTELYSPTTLQTPNIFQWVKKKVWVWGFNPGYTQREKNAERNKMRAVLFFLQLVFRLL